MLTQLLGNRGKDLGSLFKASVKLFGDRGVLDPSIRRFRFSLFNHCVFILSVLSLFYSVHTGWGAIAAAIWFFLLLPYSFFYATRMKACQSWMVYGAITGKPATFADAREVTRKQKWTLRMFAFIELLFSVTPPPQSENSNQKSSFTPSLARMFFSALETVFDVAEDYLLPATVIEQKPIQETVKKLEQLKQNIPASLSGAFGIDLFGNAISSFVFVFDLAIWTVGALVGFLLAPVVPQNMLSVVPADLIHTISFLPAHIFLAPLLLSFVISSLLHCTLKLMVATLKNIYFSVFYTSINHPLEIMPELRDGLTHYLNRDDSSYLESVKNQFSVSMPELAKGASAVQKTPEQSLQIIEAAFRENVSKGQSIEVIADFLKNKGYVESDILSVMQKYKRTA